MVLPTRRKTPSVPEPLTPSVEEEEIEALEPDHVAPESESLPATLNSSEEKPKSYSQIFDEITKPVAMTAEEAPEPPAKKVAKVTLPESGPEIPVEPKKMRVPSRAIALLGVVTLLAISAIVLFTNPPTISSPVLVDYSAYLSNSSNESYLGLDITNPEGMASDMEMTLPPNVDQSISARGGIVTISHGANTMVRMNSSSDANVKIYLQGNWTTIPVTLSFAAPDDYDTSLQVHGQDYFVTRKNESLILMFNLTGEGVRFEQSYIRKR